MKINKAPKVAALSLVAALACTKSDFVEAITCDGTNTTDFKALSFDIQPPSAQIPLPTGWFKIRNQGSNPNRARIYFDFYEVDANQNELSYFSMVYNDNLIPPGGELLRTVAFMPLHVSEGRHYKGVVRYECDTDSANNAMLQTAWGTGGTSPNPEPEVPQDRIFSDSFEDTPATAMAKHFRKFANAELEVVIEETKHEDGGFSILGYMARWIQH